MDPSWDMANMFGENVGWVNVGESYGLIKTVRDSYPLVMTHMAMERSTHF